MIIKANGKTPKDMKVNWNTIEWGSIFLYYIIIICMEVKLSNSGSCIVEIHEYYILKCVMILFLLIPKGEGLGKHIINQMTMIKILVVLFSYIIFLTVAMALVMFITQES